MIIIDDKLIAKLADPATIARYDIPCARPYFGFASKFPCTRAAARSNAFSSSIRINSESSSLPRKLVGIAINNHASSRNGLYLSTRSLSGKHFLPTILMSVLTSPSFISMMLYEFSKKPR